MGHAGVEAEVVVLESWLGGLLRGVAADEEAVVEAGGGIFEARPEEVFFGEVGWGLGVIGGGVSEENGREFVVIGEAGEESPVAFGEIAEMPRVVGFEGFDAAVEEPEAGVGRSVTGVLHHDFMIAAQGDELGGGFELEEGVEDAFGVGAAVDVVAEGDDGVVGARGEGVEEAAEGSVPAVDVTEDVGHGGRLVRRRKCRRQKSRRLRRRHRRRGRQ